MLPFRAFDYKRLGLQAAGTLLIVMGLSLKATLLLVRAFGTGWLVFLGIASVGIPLAILLEIGWRTTQKRGALFSTVVLVLGVLYIFRQPISHSFSEGMKVVTDPKRNFADMSDYLSHPGDISAVWGKRKYQVNGTLDTRFSLPNDVRVIVQSYDNPVELRIGKSACQSVVEKEQECRFQFGGELILDSKGKPSQTYIEIINPE